MKFKVKKTDLLRELQKTSGIVDPRGTMPILSNILIDTVKPGTLSIQATDLKITYRGECPADIQENGTIVINGKKIADITKELDGEEILFSKKENNWVSIVCNKSNFLVPGIAPEEFPVLPEFIEEKSIKIEFLPFKDMIRKTLMSISNDNTRPSLIGANIKIDGRDILMLSTDGHRLSCIERSDFLEKPAEESIDVILSKKSLSELMKIDDTGQPLHLFLYDSQIFFKINKSLLIVRPIDAKYPDIMYMIPSLPGKFRAIVQKNNLMHALRRVTVLADEECKMLRASLSSNSMELTTFHSIAGEAKDSVPVRYEGDEIQVSFNALYLFDVLSVLSDEVFIDVYGDQSPFLVGCPKSIGYRYMVMPMRIQKEHDEGGE